MARIKSSRGCVSGISSFQLKVMIHFPPENRQEKLRAFCTSFKLALTAPLLLLLPFDHAPGVKSC